MLKRGGGRDADRAAAWFVRWWREEGSALSANSPLLAEHESEEADSENASVSDSGRRYPHASGTGSEPSRLLSKPTPAGKFADGSVSLRGGWGFDFQWDLTNITRPHGTALGFTAESAESTIEEQMGRIIDDYMCRVKEEETSGDAVSETQRKKREKEVARAKREKRVRDLLAARRAGGGKK